MTTAQEKEREPGFDYLVLMKCAKIEEDFLAPTWGEDNPTALKRGVFLFCALVVSLLARLGSDARCAAPWPWPCVQVQGEAKRPWNQAGVELQPFYLALPLDRLLTFSQLHIPSRPMSKTIPIAQVRIH